MARTLITNGLVVSPSGPSPMDVRLDGETLPGAYTITASAADISASTQVTVSATAPLLSAPGGVPVLGDHLSVFLPMIRR